jgi:SAM-dependent methyltransferase
MHTEALDYTRQALDRVGGPVGRHILEIGSLYINGGARDLCAGATSYLGLDRVAGPGVDLPIDARDFDGQGAYDLVICNEVLEHEADPAVVIACAARALAPGGWLILTCASTDRKPHSATGAEHPLPGEYYGNVSADALRGLLEGWEIVDVSYLYPPGDARALARKVAP